jgi:hypothetical protein
MTTFVLIEIGVFFLQSKAVQREQQASLPVSQNLSTSAMERDVYYLLIEV